MKITVTIAVCLFLVAVVPLQASSLLLLDEQGTPLGRIPQLVRGEEQFIPLTVLASKSDWSLQTEAGAEILTVDTFVIRARRDNPFYFLNGECRQFIFAPQEWDGALWVPLSGLLESLPPELLHRHPQDGSLRIRKAAASTETESPEPRGAKEESGLPNTPASPSAWTMSTVIIDPGHGGKDPGAVSPGGTREKDVVLDISRRLAKILLAKGMVAKLTRYGDHFIPLAERTKFANTNRGDLFVSIHCNSSKVRSARGCETYFLSPARTESAVDVAMRENSVVQLEENALQYKEMTEENYILLTMATSQYLKDSQDFADLALQEVVRRTPLPRRWVDQAGFYVLIGASMPAIVFEVGFLSNPDDENFLGSKQGRQKIAEALARSILKLKSQLEAEALQ
jgi:N-acetylmuramoyl-L-alanine amidase